MELIYSRPKTMNPRVSAYCPGCLHALATKVIGEVLEEMDIADNTVAVEDIAAGIHNSVAQRVAGMAGRIGLEPDFAISGGVALNIGVVHALERALGHPVTAHPYCQIVGALGASRLAWEHTQKKG